MSKPKAFLDEESSFEGKYSRQVFETLFFAYRPFFLRLVLLLSVGFVSRLVLLGNANVIGMWVDTLCREPAVCRPVPEFFAGFGHQEYLKLLGLMTLTGFLLTVFFRVGFSRLSSLAVSRLYDETTLRTSRLPIQFFDSNPVGRVVTRFSSDYGSVFRLFGGPLAEFFAIIFDLAAMLILVSVASPFYIPILVVISLANFVVYRLNRDRLRLERRDLSASRSPSIAHFAETAQGASTIRIFSRQRTFGERFSILNERFLNQKLSATAAVLRFSMQMSSLTAFLLLMTGTLGYFLSAQGLVSIGSIGVAFTFVILSGTSLQTFFEWLGQLEEAMTGVERLNDYLRRELEPGSKLPASRSFSTSHPVYAPGEEAALRRARMVPQAAAAVTVEGLWFRYGADLPWVLKDLDFVIRPGEKIGIVGRTGSGKTSFVQALFHLYPFERGRILVDGIRPRLMAASGEVAGPEETDLGLFRRSIALISQEPTLFRGTLRENLDLTGSHEDRRLQEVLARVGLEEWLESQPLGLRMMIEERGKNLSAGEKQLLCMARCLLQDAPVVVMDEATSSVDPQSEEILVRATREFFADRTQIIIAHRLSTLDDCDRILWLHRGEIRMFDRPEVVLPVFKNTELNV
jgi:ABC-type multidrug transport system fused ATPase/permease subunit